MRPLFAEMYGTFLLTLVDASMGILGAHYFEIGFLARCLAPVAAVVSLVFLIGEVSGAHINPAVTFAFAARGVFPWKRLIGYWLAQILGALLAGGLIAATVSSHLEKSVTTRHNLSYLSAFGVETLLTWILITAVIVSSRDSQIKGWESAFPVGATLLFCGLIGKHLTGPSMNPARSIGTALYFDTQNLWLYLTAPLVGSLLGMITAYLLRGSPTAKEREAAKGK